MAPTRLDRNLLTRLERVLKRQPGGLATAYAPGQPYSKVKRVLEASGLSAVEEALTWWTWRDGGDPAILPGLQPAPLAVALDHRTEMRGLAREITADSSSYIRDPDVVWHPAWVLIFGTGARQNIVIDGSAGAEQPSPLRSVDFAEIGQPDYAEIVAPSLGSFISDAVHALEQGRFTFDETERQWLPWNWTDMPVGERFSS